MTKFESRIGKITHDKEKVYNFLSDFKNFKQFLPEDKVKNWQSEGDTCSFSVTGVGDVGLKMIEKSPSELIKITGTGMANIEFYLWIQLKEVEKEDTRVKLTMKAELNPMIKMVASKPLKNFLELMVKYMEEFSYELPDATEA